MAAPDRNQIRIVAQAVARPENIGKVRAVLMSMIVPTRAEKGCIDYDLNEVMGDPNQFVLLETWESETALEAHTRTPHYQDLERAQSMLAEPLKITKLRRLL